MEKKFVFREAIEADLPAIIAMLADDELGMIRETVSNPIDQSYTDAYAQMQNETGNQIIVAVDDEGYIQGCLQLTFTTGLARRGIKRATVEGVRVVKDSRGKGLGKLMFHDAFKRAGNAGCGLVQLTTDITREGAHKFYVDLGFEVSHAGLKMKL